MKRHAAHHTVNVMGDMDLEKTRDTSAYKGPTRVMERERQQITMRLDRTHDALRHLHDARRMRRKLLEYVRHDRGLRVGDEYMRGMNVIPGTQEILLGKV